MGSPDFDITDSQGNLALILAPLALITVVLTITSFLIFVGLSLGIRRAYVHLLLKVFEYITSATNGLQSSDRSTSDAASDENHRRTGALIERKNPLSMEGILNFYDDIKPDVENKMVLASLGAFYYVKAGLEAIVDDQVTQRFSAENLQTWNLLTRTNTYQHINLKLTILWGIGFCLRYCLLLPFRICLALCAVAGLIVGTSITPFISQQRRRDAINAVFVSFFCRLFMRSFSSVITFHNLENRANSDGICVANHTSPIDAIILSCDRLYAMVGQRQTGFVGLMQSVFGSSDAHVWFDRSEIRDRMGVTRRMQAHVEDPEKNPILIFPEGTCINNTSVMMFKKGSFETGGVIYPAAIKYDSRFADCFWNSSKEGFVRHLMRMITSWAIVADVWYLPPMHQEAGESSIKFAQRVKNCIAQQGGLVDLEWDGNLKRTAPKPEMKLKQRKYFSDKFTEHEQHREEQENFQEEFSNVKQRKHPEDVDENVKSDEKMIKGVHNIMSNIAHAVGDIAGDVVA